MQYQKSIDIEFKSKKAKKIVNQVPSFIIRMGIISLVLVFSITILILSLINIEPQIKTKVILINNGQITGYLFFPYKKTIPIHHESSYVVKIEHSNISFLCKADLDNKKIYIENKNTYWRIPLIFEKSHVMSDYIITSQINAYSQIKLPKISILKWLTSNSFY